MLNNLNSVTNLKPVGLIITGPLSTKGGAMNRNIILLLLDTARAQDVYGNPKMANVSRIAKDSTTYLNTVAPGTWTAPTHAALFTDSKVSTIKRVSQDFFSGGSRKISPWMVDTKFIDGSSSTLASKLSKYGYYSVLLSNNPFLTSYTNLASGFDKTYDIWKHSNSKYNKKMVDKVSFIFEGGSKTRERIYKASHMISKVIPRVLLDKVYMDLRLRLDKGVAEADGTYRLDRGANDTNKALSKYLKYNYNYAPQFIFINYIEAHENYPVSEDILQDKWLYLSGIEEMSEDRMAALHDAYNRRLAYLDKKIGETIQVLKSSGMLENATVILTSDHGQMFGEHGLLYHAMPPYDGIAKVPLIAANYENGRPVRQREEVETPVSQLSLHKAVLDLASGRYEHLNGNLRRDKKVFCEHTGISEGWDEQLLSFLKSKSSVADRIYKAKMRHNHKVTAVYSGKYKLIHYFGKQKDELYDLQSDPQETSSIIDSNRGIANSMLG